MGKTHWKKVVSDPVYIGEADFEPGEEKILTIASVNQKETIQTAEGKSVKAVVHWVENEKAMILNVARGKAISKAVGSTMLEDWPGHKVQLYIDDKVKAFGEIVSAVRVRSKKPVEAPAIVCEGCGKDIKPGFNMTADQLAAYTKSKYGKKLCAECAKAQNEKKESSK